MSTTNADRVKASRLRGRQKEGFEISEEQAAWLREYTGKTSTRVRFTQAAAPTPSPPPPPVAGSPPVVESFPDFKPLSFESDAPATPVVEHVQCAIPDCPRCRQVDNAQVCGATNLRVYPKMADESARALAGLVLGFVSIVARIFGRLFKPNDSESKMLAKSIATVAYRRASWTGSVDDLLALAFAIGSVGTRVYNSPKIEVQTTGEDA